jgi:hypothetical protein
MWAREAIGTWLELMFEVPPVSGVSGSPMGKEESWGCGDVCARRCLNVDSLCQREENLRMCLLG